VMFKTGVTGEVLGVSGSTRGLLYAPTFGKLAFILGLVLSGVIMNQAYGGFEDLPPREQSTGDRVRFLLRLFFGGGLVGFGTALGNGCTSGHGLTGLARLTIRSWVAVPTFMVCAAVAATAFGTATDLPTQPFPEEDVVELDETVAIAAGLIALVLMAMGAAAVYRRLHPEAEPAVRLKIAAELLSGLTFGAGLSLSTMVRASKVAGFLDLGSGTWDGSLMFVMGGALCVTFPFHQTLQRIAGARPLLGGGFGLPPRCKPVDWSLVLGAMIFGLGWGTCGMCPGPMWVALGGKPCLDVALCILGMLGGMGVWVVMKKLEARRDARVVPEPDAKAAAKIAPPGMEEAKVEEAAASDIKAFSGAETETDVSEVKCP